MAEETEVVEERKSRIGLVFAGLALGVLLLFVFQNTDKTNIDFLWFTWSMPKFLLIFITVGLTLVLSIITAWILNRRSRRK